MSASGDTSDGMHPHEKEKWGYLALAAALGVAVGAGSAVAGLRLPAAFLLGLVLFSWSYAIPLLRRILGADPAQTRERIEGMDPGRVGTDLVVLVGAAAGLAGVGWMLAGKPDDGAKFLEALLTLAAVGSGWFLIHLMYAMRYARHWFNSEEDCIDYHMDTEPAYSDFLYTAFAVGVSFAISDTDLKTTKVRRIAWGQALLSYLFGTVVVAATINLIAGLAA